MVSIKTALEFEEAIKEDKVFVDFYADWCGPCKMLDMVLEEVETECPDVHFVKVDSDRFRSIAKDYHVLTVPCLILFSQGKVVKQQSGFLRKEELIAFLNQE